MVVVNDLGAGVHGEQSDEPSPAESVVAEIEALGGRAIADGTSVTDWDGVARLVARCVEVFGSLDAVVNNAGIVRDRMITSTTEDDFDAVISVHLKGTYALTKHACDHWRQVAKDGGSPSGRIVNTTSGAGLRGNVGQSVYGSAKAAIAGLTVVTAMEMARYGVTANAISPMALTRMVDTMPSMAGRSLADGFDPLDPSNAAPVVTFLCSAASGWISGQVLRIAGGLLQRMRGWEVASPQHRAAGGGRLATDEIGLALQTMYGVFPTGITVPTN
jgi:NAD(P)-dependent dehydrogenase (short-subunit alcohol dehydrogenase family)